jgi:putative addiction module component (TIGR02574 family)
VAKHHLETDMSTTLEALTSEAMKLTPEERTELMERLADSVLPTVALHPAWTAELARRVAAMDAGTDPSIPAEEVLAELRALASKASARPS